MTARGPDGADVQVSLVSIAQLADGKVVAEWGHAEVSGI
jgi:hypothetical protein